MLLDFDVGQLAAVAYAWSYELRTSNGEAFIQAMV
jgi:hypothetical protein